MAEIRYCPQCREKRQTTCCGCGCGNCVVCGHRWICGIVPPSIIKTFQTTIDCKIHWNSSEMLFDCPCGKKEIYLDAELPNKFCDCGRIYRIVYRLEHKTK